MRRAYFDRALGRLFPRARGSRRSTARAVGQRNAALRRVANGVSSRDAVDPWTEQVAALGTRARGCAAARARAVDARLRAADRRVRARARRGLRTRVDPSRVEQLDDAARSRPRAGHDEPGPHLDDSRCSPVTATCGPTARRASSASRCSRCFSPRPRSCSSAAASPRSCCSTTCSPSSTRSGAATLARAPAAGRADAHHVDHGGRAAARARTSCSRWPRARCVRREEDRLATSRASSAGSGPRRAWCEIVEAWPGAVGPTIARNAWPARIARDGTLHVATSSSSWAFELAQLEADVLKRLRSAAGKDAPAKLRFAVGKLPELGPEDDARRDRKAPSPGPERAAEGGRTRRRNQRRGTPESGRESGRAEPLQKRR